MSGIDSLETITALRAKRLDCAENLSESGFTILLYPTVFERKKETRRFAKKQRLALYVNDRQDLLKCDHGNGTLFCNLFAKWDPN